MNLQDAVFSGGSLGARQPLFLLPVRPAKNSHEFTPSKTVMHRYKLLLCISRTHFYNFQRRSNTFASIAYSNVAQRVRRALFLEAASRARRASSACTERPKRSNSEKL